MSADQLLDAATIAVTIVLYFAVPAALIWRGWITTAGIAMAGIAILPLFLEPPSLGTGLFVAYLLVAIPFPPLLVLVGIGVIARRSFRRVWCRLAARPSN